MSFKMDGMVVPQCAVVMAGGSGERFWPVSTPDKPKQLLDLTGSGRNLLQQAVDRVLDLFGDEIYVSTSDRLAEPLRDADIVQASHILAEPLRKNTLGALIYSMGRIAANQKGDFVAAILTADHRIHPDSLFRETVMQALEMAKSTGGLVTLGVRPTRPETGYGYIELGKEPNRVARFREKPNQQTAEEFVASGRYLWNSGMFFWRYSAFRAELEAADPLYAKVLDDIEEGDFASFAALPNLSIDVALMEHSAKVYVIPAEFAWDDLGAWDSLRRTVPADGDGNVSVGEVRLVESRDCIVFNRGRQRISVLGMDATVVVATDDEVVVLPVDRAQDARKLSS